MYQYKLCHLGPLIEEVEECCLWYTSIIWTVRVALGFHSAHTSRCQFQHSKHLRGIDLHSHIQKGGHQFFAGYTSFDFLNLTGEVVICFDLGAKALGCSFDCAFHFLLYHKCLLSHIAGK